MKKLKLYSLQSFALFFIIVSFYAIHIKAFGALPIGIIFSLACIMKSYDYIDLETE